MFFIQLVDPTYPGEERRRVAKDNLVFLCFVKSKMCLSILSQQVIINLYHSEGAVGFGDALYYWEHLYLLILNLFNFQSQMCYSPSSSHDCPSYSGLKSISRSSPKLKSILSDELPSSSSSAVSSIREFSILVSSCFID